MAHYAFINENNLVVQVIVGKDESNFDWENYYSMQIGMMCKRTSYNTRGGIYYIPGTDTPDPDQSKSFRKNYAGIGYSYDSNKDAFIPPKPFESWVLNESSCLWESPIPYPDDGKKYAWDELQTKWVEVQI